MGRRREACPAPALVRRGGERSEGGVGAAVGLLWILGERYEGVAAEVDDETGERLFAPETVGRLQEVIWGKMTPARFHQCPRIPFRGIAADRPRW